MEILRESLFSNVIGLHNLETSGADDGDCHESSYPPTRQAGHKTWGLRKRRQIAYSVKATGQDEGPEQQGGKPRIRVGHEVKWSHQNKGENVLDVILMASEKNITELKIQFQWYNIFVTTHFIITSAKFSYECISWKTKAIKR